MLVMMMVGGGTGACVGHNTADACRTSRDGARCAWANKKICMTPDAAQQRLDSKNIETVEPPRCAKRGQLSRMLIFQSWERKSLATVGMANCG